MVDGQDNVTLVGEPTSGHFSDQHELKLPNGWKVTYSGERYTDARGNRAAGYQRVPRVLNQLKGCLAHGYGIICGSAFRGLNQHDRVRG